MPALGRFFEHSKGSPESTQRALEFLESTEALGHLRQLVTQALRILRHSRHLRTWALEVLYLVHSSQ